MPRKMPKKLDVHDNDWLAQKNLKRYFKNWNMIDARDVSSGIEYGQDWIVGIVEDTGEVTGMEFRVQSKVLSGNDAIHGDFICDDLRVTTLNYLSDLSVPVLLHFYHQSTRKAYVIWLHDWYLTNRRVTWEDQQTVKVKIPLEFVLNHERAKLIYKRVAHEHHKTTTRRNIDITNALDKDHHVDVVFDDSVTRYVIYPKHDGAIPELIPLDSEAAMSVQQMLKTGLLSQLTGKFDLRNSGLDRLNVDGEIVSILMMPYAKELPSHPMRIKFLDELGSIVFEIKYIDFKPIQNGYELKRWKGVSKTDHVIIEFELNESHKTLTPTLQFIEPTTEHDNPRNWDRLFTVIHRIGLSKKCKFIHLREDRVIYEDSISLTFPDSPQIRSVQALAKALTMIDDIMGILIPMPKAFSGKEILLAQTVAKVIETGIYHELLEPIFSKDDSVLILSGSKEWAKSRISEPYNTVMSYGPDIYVDILGQEINLGTCEFVFEQLEYIQVHDESEGEVSIEFRIDRERAFTRFLRWYKATYQS